ncbi:MAG: transposase [Candidatus Rokubacteria bacterium]|nr:transposase [Candidatus Rokubacteria bacterium]
MDAQVAIVAEAVQVAAKPRRRTYTAEHTRRILKEADACTTPGAVGALLRREGLYSSHLVVWRRAQFKTLKYRPDFPARFGAYEDAETFCQQFFPWYNTEHRHGALGLMTPHDLHYGLAAAKWQQRAEVLRAAYAAHPERFPRGVPVPPTLPTAAWIN